MNLATLMLIMAGILAVIFLILFVVLLTPPRREEENMSRNDKSDLKKIKDQIEHEVEDDMMHEIEPLKPSRKRRK